MEAIAEEFKAFEIEKTDLVERDSFDLPDRLLGTDLEDLPEDHDFVNSRFRYPMIRSENPGWAVIFDWIPRNVNHIQTSAGTLFRDQTFLGSNEPVQKLLHDLTFFSITGSGTDKSISAIFGNLVNVNKTPDAVYSADMNFFVEWKTADAEHSLEKKIRDAQNKYIGYVRSLEAILGEARGKRSEMVVIAVSSTAVLSTIPLSDETRMAIGDSWKLTMDLGAGYGWDFFPRNVVNDDAEAMEKVVLEIGEGLAESHSDPLAISKERMREINGACKDGQFAKYALESLTSNIKVALTQRISDIRDSNEQKFEKQFMKGFPLPEASSTRFNRNIVHLPLCIEEDCNVSKEQIATFLGAESMYSKIWMHALRTQSPPEPLQAEPLFGYNPSKSERNKVKKTFSTMPLLTEHEKLLLGERGVCAKSSLDQIKLKRLQTLKEQGPKEYSAFLKNAPCGPVLTSPAISDIEHLLLSPEDDFRNWLMEQVPGESEVDNLKQLYPDLSEDLKALDPTNEFRSLEKTRLCRATYFLRQLCRELSLNMRNNLPEWFFHCSQINKNSWVLCRVSHSRGPMFFSVLSVATDQFALSQQNIWGRPELELAMGKSVIRIWPFYSLTAEQISHQASSWSTVLGLGLLLKEAERREIGKSKRSVGPMFHVSHWLHHSLVYLEDKAGTVADLQTPRFLYGNLELGEEAEVFEGLCRLERSTIRSRLQLFNCVSMRNSFVRMRDIANKNTMKEIIRDGREFNGDKQKPYRKSWITGEGSLFLQTALDLSYLLMLHNKDEGEAIHGYLQIFEKVMEMEKALYDTMTSRSGRLIQEIPGSIPDPLVKCKLLSAKRFINIPRDTELRFQREEQKRGCQFMGNSDPPTISEIKAHEFSISVVREMGEKARQTVFANSGCADMETLIQKRIIPRLLGQSWGYFNTLKASAQDTVLDQLNFDDLARELTRNGFNVEINGLRQAMKQAAAYNSKKMRAEESDDMMPEAKTAEEFTKDFDYIGLYLNHGRRAKACENVAELLERLKGESLKESWIVHPFLALPKILASLETKGLVVCLFKKGQNNGIREIFILSIEGRICINFVEEISRCVSQYLEIDCLTNTKSKEHFVQTGQSQIQDLKAKNAKYSTKCHVTGTNSMDAKTWCQQFVMLVFATFYLGFFGPDSPWMWAIGRILNQVTWKRLLMPIELLMLLWDKRHVCSWKHKIMDEFKAGFLKGGGFCSAKGSPFLYNRSNMMQGITHVTSSIVHASFLLLFKAWLVKEGAEELLKFLKRKTPGYDWTKSGNNFIGSRSGRIRSQHDFVVCFTPVYNLEVSSDDRGTRLTYICSESAECMVGEWVKIVLKTEADLAPLFCARVSKAKSVLACLSNFFEFNSQWFYQNSLISVPLKFVVSAVKMGAETDFISRIQDLMSERSALIEHGLSVSFTFLVQILQLSNHYFLMCPTKSLKERLFRSLEEKKHPFFGYMPYEPGLLSGILGFRGAFCRLLSINSVSRQLDLLMRGEEILDNEGPLSLQYRFGVRFGDSVKFRRISKRLSKDTYDPEKFFSEHPDLFLEKPTSYFHLRASLCRSLFTSSMYSALAFFKVSDVLAASRYILTHCVFKTDFESDRIPGLHAQKVSLFYLIEKKFQVALETGVKVPAQWIESRIPECEFYRSLDKSYSRLPFTTTEPPATTVFRKAKVSLRKESLFIEHELLDCVKFIWFKKTQRANHESLFVSWTKYKAVFPWLQDGLEETVRSAQRTLRAMTTSYMVLKFVESIRSSKRTIFFSGRKISEGRAEAQIRDFIRYNTFQNRSLLLDLGSRFGQSERFRAVLGSIAMLGGPSHLPGFPKVLTSHLEAQAGEPLISENLHTIGNINDLAALRIESCVNKTIKKAKWNMKDSLWSYKFPAPNMPVPGFMFLRFTGDKYSYVVCRTKKNFIVLLIREEEDVEVIEAIGYKELFLSRQLIFESLRYFREQTPWKLKFRSKSLAGAFYNAETNGIHVTPLDKPEERVGAVMMQVVGTDFSFVEKHFASNKHKRLSIYPGKSVSIDVLMPSLHFRDLGSQIQISVLSQNRLQFHRCVIFYPSRDTMNPAFSDEQFPDDPTLNPLHYLLPKFETLSPGAFLDFCESHGTVMDLWGQLLSWMCSQRPVRAEELELVSSLYSWTQPKFSNLTLLGVLIDTVQHANSLSHPATKVLRDMMRHFRSPDNDKPYVTPADLHYLPMTDAGAKAALSRLQVPDVMGWGVKFIEDDTEDERKVYKAVSEDLYPAAQDIGTDPAVRPPKASHMFYIHEAVEMSRHLNGGGSSARRAFTPERCLWRACMFPLPVLLVPGPGSVATLENWLSDGLIGDIWERDRQHIDLFRAHSLMKWQSRLQWPNWVVGRFSKEAEEKKAGPEIKDAWQRVTRK